MIGNARAMTARPASAALLLPVELHVIHAVALVADLGVHDRGCHVDLLLVRVAQEAQVVLRAAAGGRRRLGQWMAMRCF